MDPVDRREFVGLVMAVILGSGVDPNRLTALLSATSARQEGPRAIGVSDVTSIERLTAVLRNEYYAVGSGLSRTAAVGPLREVHAWIGEATCTEEVRTRLVRAAADLAWVAGWASWDAGADADARCAWTYALQQARRVGDPDLTVAILLDLSHRALATAHGTTAGPGDTGPKAALSITTLASTVIDTSDQPLSPHTVSNLHAHRAWCYASMGAPEKAEAALKQEEDSFAADRHRAPVWAHHVTTAELASHRAHASALLARVHPPSVDVAIEQLNDIVRTDALAYLRTMAFHLPDLSACYFRVGDTSAAVSTGRNAVAAAKNLSSQHVRRKLHLIDNAVTPTQRKNSDVTQVLNSVQANSI